MTPKTFRAKTRLFLEVAAMRCESHNRIIALYHAGKVSDSLVALSWKRYARAHNTAVDFYYSAGTSEAPAT